MHELKLLLEMKNITKIYDNGFIANSAVDLTVKNGEIHALMGENGAGKSTLMKVLFGNEQAEEGQIFYKNEPVTIKSPKEALQLGIGMVHQHFKLVPSLTIYENVALGHEPTKGLFIDKKKTKEDVEALCKKYNFNLNVNDKVENLSIGKKQKVEILKSLHQHVDLLILDEPTAVLTPQETQELFEQLLQLKNDGISIIFISHKLNEIKQICDRITIMRLGKSMGTYDVDTLTEQDISRLMVGRDVFLELQKNPVKLGKTCLQVEHLSFDSDTHKKILDDINFSIKAGEIVGIAGVEGSGQSQLVDFLVGKRKVKEALSGKVTYFEKNLENETIKNIRDLDISYIPEDRINEGLAINMSISENIISSIYDDKKINQGLFQNKTAIADFTQKGINEYVIKCEGESDLLKNLSGGNMQKVVCAREMMQASRVIIAEQPTRGVDVGAIEVIHNKLVELRDSGVAILLISADLNEILELSDSIIVLSEGKMTGYFADAKQVTEEELGFHMLGVKQQNANQLKEALR